MPPRRAITLPAVGAGPIKRTPLGVFDKAAMSTTQTYVVEAVKGCRPDKYDASGREILDWKYLISWGGPWSKLSGLDTWEPTRNLAGCEDMLEDARLAHLEREQEAADSSNARKQAATAAMQKSTAARGVYQG